MTLVDFARPFRYIAFCARHYQKWACHIVPLTQHFILGGDDYAESFCRLHYRHTLLFSDDAIFDYMRALYIFIYHFLPHSICYFFILSGEILLICRMIFLVIIHISRFTLIICRYFHMLDLSR